jgi:hypothetical protein
MISKKQIFQLFKSAAEDIASFYPEWVKEHPEIKKLKLLTEVKKEIPVADYRESIQVDFAEMVSTDTVKSNNINDFLGNVYAIISDYLDKINLKIRSLLDEAYGFSGTPSNDEATSEEEKKEENSKKVDLLNQLYNGLQELSASMEEDTIVSKSSEINPTTGQVERKLSKILVTARDVKFKVGKDTIYLPANSFIPTACSVFYKKYLSIMGEPPATDSSVDLLNILSLDSYKRLEYAVSEKYEKELEKKKSQNFEIVFSKQPSDLLSMSIRSDWVSCQNLLREQTSYNYKAIYSAVSPYVGIIYVTNKIPYKERGEEMVARALVFYLEHKNSDQAALTLGNVYTNFYPGYFDDLFRDSLRKHTDLPIISYNEASNNYYFPTEAKDTKEAPYFDRPIELAPPRKKSTG